MRCRRVFASTALVTLMAAGPSLGPSPAVVVVPRAIVDSMSAIWARANEGWDKLADLNWMERNLGTIRATQREFLGCLMGEVRGDTVYIDDWVPARNMKRLMLAVTGDCSGHERFLGTFHTHPYLADTQNRATKQRFLAPQDRNSFDQSDDRIEMIVWDVDSLDAAVRTVDGEVLHPAPIVVR